MLLSGGERILVGDTALAASVVAPPAGAPTTIVSVPRGGDAGDPSASMVERARLRRTVRLAVAASLAAVAVLAVVLAVTGALGGGDDDEPPTASAPPREAGVPEIVDRVRPSTVVVNALVEGVPSGGGTGWVLDAAEGLIVTNHHVVNGGTSFSVGVDGGDRPATLVGAAPCEDLAVLRVGDSGGLATLPLGSQEMLRQGQTVVAVGFPGTASADANLVPTPGVVSVVRTRFDLDSIDVPNYPNVIQTTAVINPGNSGGPLVDTEGRLVGVNSAGITLLGERIIQGQGYAIGVDRVKEVVPTLRAGRSIGWTGMGLTHVFDPVAQGGGLVAADLPVRAGLRVDEAVPGTAAATAGFGEEPVLITAVNGAPMDGSLSGYCAAIDDGRGAESAVFTVIPAGETEPRDVRVPFQ